MTYKITQYEWFRWFDDANNRIFEEREVLFEALASGAPASTTHVTLYGNGYYLEVDGTDLAVDGNGRLTSGTITLVALFDATTNLKMVQEESDGLNVAAYLQDYLADAPYEANPDAAGYMFDASLVQAQALGAGIGVYGTNEGDDTIFGSQGSDEFIAYGGDDQVHGNGGDDLLWGETGNDTMWGGTGNDDLRGFTGNDSLKGEAGNDYLGGWIGKDTLDGGAGYDDLYGGAGNDSLLGG
jgi:Ca2+-binding RTX toxin-like protein